MPSQPSSWDCSRERSAAYHEPACEGLRRAMVKRRSRPASAGKEASHTATRAIVKPHRPRAAIIPKNSALAVRGAHRLLTSGVRARSVASLTNPAAARRPLVAARRPRLPAMDLNSLLNNDAPTRPSSVSHTSSHGPTPYIPSPSHRPSPFHTSPSSAQGFSFPPPSPRPEQLPHQGYAQSPIGTPHPLSAQSTVPGSTPASASPLGSFSQTHQYSPLPQQHPTHALPAQTSPSPIASYIPHHHHGYPRQSPIASPVGGRGTHVQPVSGRATPAIAAPLPRDREKEREREGGRERERSASYRRERERDISVSPKTKVPFIAGEVVSPSFEGLPSREKPSYGSETPTGTPSGTLSRSASHHQSRPASQHLSAADVVFTRRSSMVPAGRGMDIMEVDGEGTPDRKWSSPVAERAGNPNGTGAQGHPPAPYANSLGPPNNSHHALAPAPPPSPAASLSNLPSEQPAMPVQHTPLPAQHLQRSTPTPTGFAAKPSPTAASAPIPAPPSPKRQPLLQSLGPPPTPTQSSGTADVANGSPNSSGPPRKRPRREEAPIWARKASRSSSSSPVLSGRRQPGMASAMAVNHPPPLPQHIVQNTTGQHQPRPPPPPTTSHHILSEYGPWEPTIINQQPIPELTREVANFLYRNVVMQTDPQLTANGGAMLEIEAKIGHLIDKNTNDRLRLPVLTETVMNDNDPSWRTQFRSSMTEVPCSTITLALTGQVHLPYLVDTTSYYQ